MMSVSRVWLSVLVLLLSASVTVASQSGDRKAGHGAPKVVVDGELKNFGEVGPGTILKHSFVITNEGTSDLIIEKVSPG